jgi:hypothetical protein
MCPPISTTFPNPKEIENNFLKNNCILETSCKSKNYVLPFFKIVLIYAYFDGDK